MSTNGSFGAPDRKRKVLENSTSASSLDGDLDGCRETCGPKKIALFQPNKRFSKVEDDVPSVQSKRDSSSKSDSDDEGNEKCPICLKGLTSQTLSITDTCSHHIFCLSCLEEWSKTKKTCPVDRKEYNSILVLDSRGNVMKQLSVRSLATDSSGSWPASYEQTFCDLCGRFTNEELMLICDGCGMGYHLYCLMPPMQVAPSGIWLCNDCWYYYNH